MAKFYILLLFFSTYIFFLRAQDYNIKGRVTDEQGKPLSDVHIFLSQSKKGTVSNNDGYFVLHSDKNSEVMSVSCIGYKNFEQIISVNTGFINITLYPGVILLDEFLVVNLSAADLLKKAIEKRPDNYQTKPFLTKVYYRAKLSEKDTLRYMEETAFHIIKSYERGFGDTYFLVKNRNFKFKENMALRSIGQYDIVKTVENIFDRSFFKKNNVAYLPGTIFDNRKVYVVSITPKQTNDKRESKIYIDMEDLAFVRFELTMRSRDKLVAQYRRSDGKYYLTNGYSLHINRRQDHEFPAESNMTVTDIIYPFSEEDIEGIRIDQKDILNVYATQEQDTIFWSNLNAILPDTTIQQALSRFQETRTETVLFDSLQNKAYLRRLYEPNLSFIFSTQLTKDFYSLNHNSVSTSHIVNHLLTQKSRRFGIAVSYLYHLLSIPFEEVLAEQLLMNLDGLKPRMNPTILNRANSSYIHGLSNPILSDYKINHHNNFIRLHTIRNDGHFVKVQILEEELAKADLSNKNNKIAFVHIYGLELALHRIFNTYDPFGKDKKQFDTFEKQQPLIIDRNRSWVKYLFNPDVEYQRHVKKADLTEQESKYLKHSSYWSWLNLVSPQMYGISKFRMGNRNSFTFSLNYLRTPFGEQFGQNIWIMRNYSQLHGVFFKQYKNFEKTSFGVGYKLYDLQLFRNAFVTTSLDVWQQPSDFQFMTNSSFCGFHIGQLFEYQFLPDKYIHRNNMSLFIGYDYKTKGYLPESF